MEGQEMITRGHICVRVLVGVLFRQHLQFTRVRIRGVRICEFRIQIEYYLIE